MFWLPNRPVELKPSVLIIGIVVDNSLFSIPLPHTLLVFILVSLAAGLLEFVCAKLWRTRMLTMAYMVVKGVKKDQI